MVPEFPRSVFHLDIRRCLKDMETAVQQVLEENENLRKRLSEYSKDAAIQAKDQEIAYLRSHRLCAMSDEELEAAKIFREAHWKSCNNPSTYIYELVGTGIGTAITIRCPVCNMEENITDYESW